MQNQVRRVVTYSRVSTSHHGQKPEIQVEELRRYCSARGWEVVQEIVDHGYSGATESRPGLKELLTLARERKIDCVVCTKLDRLFRSLKHLLATLEEFESLGVLFVATKDCVDFSTPAGRLMASVLGALGAFERDLIVERTLAGLEYARRSGKTLGRPKTRDDAAIRTLRTKGYSFSKIQSSLGVSRGAVSRSLSPT